MPAWKKVIVSGSNISQLTNDSGYLQISSSLLASLSGSFSGSFHGDGKDLLNVTASYYPNDSIELGVKTTGSYVASLGALTGLSTTGNSGETATPTLSVIYGSGSNTSVQGDTKITIQGTVGEIEITGAISQSLGAAPIYTIGLPDNVSITQDLTVGGNLTVNGEVSYLNVTNLFVEDKFILVNSGSANPDEGGIVVDEGGGTGHAIFFEADAGINRWGFNAAVSALSSSADTTAYASAVIDLNNTNHTDVAEYQKAGNIKVETTGDIWIYS